MQSSVSIRVNEGQDEEEKVPLVAHSNRPSKRKEFSVLNMVKDDKNFEEFFKNYNVLQ